ncbi:STAS-like domain-containing protein [Candidatus Gracilibacteria bacterium]|nr:STAS-like domain-containing protein [Candidatus Gracilibacteria bacterium]
MNNSVNKSINISKDFTDAPGARFKTDGKFSGEEFYESILKPNFQSILDDESNGILFIDLDDTYGYGPSFLSETFGRLYTDFGGEEIWKHLKFKSEDNKLLIDLIHEYAKEYQETSN